MIIILMGASGAGKTTVGSALATALEWRFIEADYLHPPENIAKMQRGIGLTHADRMPWLRAVRQRINDAVARGESAVVACSALTRDYRSILSNGVPSIHFVFLEAGQDLLRERLRSRRGHFASEALLPSQLATLEDPGDTALTLDAAQPVDTLVRQIRDAFTL